LIEGLAGVVDKSTQFKEVEILLGGWPLEKIKQLLLLFANQQEPLFLIHIHTIR
jgi:hypothetical protein